MLYGQSIPHDHTPSSFKRMPNKRKLPKVAQKKKWKFNFSSSYWIVKEGQAFAISESLCKFQSKNDIYTGDNKINIMGCRIVLKAISNQSFRTMYDKWHGKL